MVFASIRVKERALGVISNTDGSFRIPLKYKSYGEILEISCLGYQTKELLLNSLTADSLHILKLNPSILSLQEAIVTAKYKGKRKLSAKQIVKRAIDNIPNNYPNYQFSTVGYYRDYQLEENQYINLNEAILEVFDLGFNKIDTTTTKTRIYKYVQNDQFQRDTLADDSYDYGKGRKTIANAFLSDYGGNEFSILKAHDAIRNYKLNSYDFINGMKDGDILDNHSFRKLPDTYFSSEQLHVIAFERKTSSYVALGKIYISLYDFAIHKLEYSVCDSLGKNNNKQLQKKGNNGRLVFEITTEYQRNSDGKMYLNYISFQNTFQLRLPPKFSFDFIGVNIDMKRFELTFNKTIDCVNDLDYDNYEGFFKNKKIKFEKLLVFENQVFLYPNLDSKKGQEMWEELNRAVVKNTLNRELVNFEVKDIKDVDGNLVNEPNIKEYNQFREFFVQEVKPFITGPADTLYMKKHQPIFENQPITKPDNFDDYWMNTPLQKFDN